MIRHLANKFLKVSLCGFLCTIVTTGFIHAGQSENIVVETLAKSGVSWDGSQLPAYPPGQPEITILKISIPPNFEIPLHRHPLINAGVLLKGSLTVTTEDNEVLHLKTGDSIIEVIDKWHSGKNEAEVTAEIIVFYAGVKGMPLSIKPEE